MLRRMLGHVLTREVLIDVCYAQRGHTLYTYDCRPVRWAQVCMPDDEAEHDASDVYLISSRIRLHMLMPTVRSCHNPYE